MYFYRDGVKKQVKKPKWHDFRAKSLGQLKFSKQAVTQVNAAQLWQSQLRCMIIKALGFSAAERVAVTMIHLSLILYYQVVGEDFLSR